MSGKSQPHTNDSYVPIASSPNASSGVQPVVESSTPAANGSSKIASPETKAASVNENTPLLPSANTPTSTEATSVDVGSDTESDDEFVSFRMSDERKRKPLKWFRILKFMLPYALPQSFRLRLISVSVLSFSMIMRVLTLIPAYALKLAVDSVAARNPKPPYFAILLYFGIQMVNSALMSVQSTLKEILESEIQQQFAVDAFHQLVHLDLSYHNKSKSGNRFAIIWRGAFSVRNLMDTVLFTAVPTCFECLVVIAIFFHLGTPLISLIVFFSVAIYWAVSKFRTDVVVKQQRKSNDIYDEMSAQEVDTLMNIETVKMFGNEDPEVEKYDGLRTSVREMEISHSSIGKVFSFATGFITKGSTSAALLLAAVGATNGKLTVGDFVLINAYIGKLFGPLMSLSRMYSSIMRSAASVETVIKMFDRESKVPEMPNAIDVFISEEDLAARKKGDISFENVSYKYKTKGRKNEAVKNVSFKVPTGKVLGVVGHSGSGKTTLMKLATRLYDVDKGTVKIDGVDVRSFKQKTFRKLFGIVSQEVSLFNTTIRNNIAYGKPEASDAEIWDALRAAALDEFVRNLPQQLETKVGERGVKLSGGEKQRVGVARCILRKPAFVILDEASSSLDSRTEKAMQGNIKTLCQGRTTIMVAHRLSTVMNADEIIVMDSSSIVERGTHKELVALGGQYYEMWKTQTTSDL